MRISGYCEQSLLHSAAAHPYKENVTDGADTYVYVMNICDSLGLECPEQKDDAAVCQYKEHVTGFAKNLGKKDKMTLRYGPMGVVGL